MSLRDRILEAADRHYDAVVSMRRAIHHEPELSNQEEQTALRLQEALKSAGIRPIKQVAGTGFSVDLKGGKPGRCIALRADMDALPIQEKSSEPYQSKVPGVMHACGHDAHSAMLFGAALILKDLQNEIPGTVRFIFQHSEEKVPSGADAMIKAGVLSDPEMDFVFAQHVSPELDAGKIGIHSGPFMASADEIYLTVKGKGGHAARPDKLVDPILIAAHLITALQSLISRETNPQLPAVLSFGDIHGYGDTNVIPDEVKLKGTLRCFDESHRHHLIRRVEDLCLDLCRSMGGNCEVFIPEGFPFLKNDMKLSEYIKRLAIELLGDEQVVDVPMRMGAEDFAHFSHQKPSFLWRLGTGNSSKGLTHGLHTSRFDIDESSMRNGFSLMAYLVLSGSNIN